MRSEKSLTSKIRESQLESGIWITKTEKEYTCSRCGFTIPKGTEAPTLKIRVDSKVENGKLIRPEHEYENVYLHPNCKTFFKPAEQEDLPIN